MKRLPNPCTCDYIHLWSDGQPFAGTPPARWDGHATVVADDDPDPLSPGWLLHYATLGDKTSNECEYAAVILALEWALDSGQQVHVITDSDLLINQVLGDYRCIPRLRPLRDRVNDLLQRTTSRLTWQGRDFNKAGWYNAKVLDTRRKARHAAAKEAGTLPPKKVAGPPRWAFKARQT